jgi:pantothenate synthetase
LKTNHRRTTLFKGVSKVVKRILEIIKPEDWLSG